MDALFNEATAFSRELANFVTTQQRGIQRVLAPILNVPGHPHIVLQDYPAPIVNRFNDIAEQIMVEMIEMEDRLNDMIHRFVTAFGPIMTPANQAPAQLRQAAIDLMTRFQQLRGELTQLQEFFIDYRLYFDDYPDDPVDTTFIESQGFFPV
jgi:hypothetical protein